MGFQTVGGRNKLVSVYIIGNSPQILLRWVQKNLTKHRLEIQAVITRFLNGSTVHEFNIVI